MVMRLQSEVKAYNQGRRDEREDLIAWLKEGEGYESIIKLIKENAHEGYGS